MPYLLSTKTAILIESEPRKAISAARMSRLNAICALFVGAGFLNQLVSWVFSAWVTLNILMIVRLEMCFQLLRAERMHLLTSEWLNAGQ
jgi:uncharacterized protein (DUF983 family)